MVDNIFNPQTQTKQEILDKVFGKKKSDAQLSCESKGGKWINNECILPEVSTPPLPQPEVFTNVKTGNIGGISIPGKDGKPSRDFLGLTPDEVAEIAARESGRGVPPEGAVPVGTSQIEAAAEAEKQRIIDEETPERRELDPELSSLSQFPVVGPVLQLARDKFRGLFGLDVNTLQPEVLRSAALTEIEKQEIERGLTASESFGQLIEAIGLSRVDIYGLSAKDLIETPSENAREVKSNLLKEKRRISNIETNVKLGYLPVSVAQEQVRDIEQNVQRLESRIKMLINNSPELQFNSDFVNTIETEILATNEKIFQAKQNVLTGATQNPTEIQILQQLLATGEEE